MKTFFKRFGALAVAFALAATLAACGGGGGGGDPAPTNPNPPQNPAPQASGKFSSISGCNVPDGQSACPASVAYTTENATAPRLMANNATVSSLPSGTATFSVTTGTTAIKLADGATTLASASVEAKCADGSTASADGTCRKAVLRYTLTNLATWTNGQIYWLGTDGAEKVLLTNNTSHQTGAIQVGTCTTRISGELLPDGQVLFRCGFGDNSPRSCVQANPVTKSISDYIGVCPPESEFSSKGTFGPEGTTSAPSKNGRIFQDPADRSQMRFQANGSSTSVVARPGNITVDGVIGVIISVSN